MYWDYFRAILGLYLEIPAPSGDLLGSEKGMEQWTLVVISFGLGLRV